MKLKRNRVKCLECGTILESFDVHDYKTCGCPQETMVDGGLEYERYGGHDMNKVQTMFEYTDDDAFLWGVLNRNTHEIVRRTLDEIDDDHLLNIALHLRTRWKDNIGLGAKEHHAHDLYILETNILPEIKARGLTEVSEEIPY